MTSAKIKELKTMIEIEFRTDCPQCGYDTWDAVLKKDKTLILKCQKCERVLLSKVPSLKVSWDNGLSPKVDRR